MVERGGEAPWDIFLAYASPDRARAWDLYNALTTLGANVCFDQAVLQGGDDWHLLLPEYVSASKVVVALISPASKKAHFQRSEVIRAINLVRNADRRLIPVRLGPDAELPYGTEQLHALDLFTDDLAKVAQQIAAAVPRVPAPRRQILSDGIPRPPRYFTGRDDLLDRLRNQQPGTTTVLTAIRGMGGVGKTSLAAAYVDIHHDDFDIVWWVRSEDPSLLVADLADLASHLGLPRLDAPTETARAVCRHLRSTDRWLLVFDNAPDERSIDEWLPQRGRGSVIITSRSPNFTNVDEILEVETLPRDAASDFLRRRVARRNPVAGEEDLGPVIDRLGGLPLALEQAAAWVANVPNRRFAQFVALYDEAATDPFPDGTRPSGYDHTATTTWCISIAAARQQASLADRVLTVLGFVAPEHLPCGWLREMGDDDYLDTAGPAAVDAALDALHAYSLATISADDTVSVHRIVQAATRRTAPTDAADFALRCLRRQAPSDARDHHHWPDLATLTPHGITLASHAATLGPTDVHKLLWLLNHIATFQTASGAVGEAITTAATAHRIAQNRLSPEHPDTLAIRHALASAYEMAGDPGRAIPLYTANLADMVRVQGADHPGTLTCHNNLAIAYKDTGDLGRATRLFEVTLANRERILGVDHPDTLTSRLGLAGAYASVGDFGRAIPLFEATLAEYERTLGAKHRSSLTTRNNLAAAHCRAGHYGRAVSLLEATVLDWDEILGADHPLFLEACNNLAMAYQGAGELDRALTLLHAALADMERVMGHDHPSTLTTRNNLAHTYHVAGDLDRAIPLYEANLADRRRVQGPEHPETLGTCNNLAGAYHVAGDLDRAIPLYEATLAEMEGILGTDHPDTLTIRGNAAGAYASAGDLDRAIPLYEATLADLERVLGTKHPNTLAVGNRLKDARTTASGRQRKPRRNDPCGCGSGKKFKLCHGR